MDLDNSYLLEDVFQHPGYVTKDLNWAAVPYHSGQFVIIHEGLQVRTCKDFETAVKYIKSQSKTKKTKSKAKLNLS